VPIGVQRGWESSFLEAEFIILPGFATFDERKACLQPDLVPQCYAAGQALAGSLLSIGSNGIPYPSVRGSGETCIACFRPALVNNPRRGDLLRLKIKVGVERFWSIA
jgi:RES domain